MSQTGSQAGRIAFGGVATKHCVHDRIKAEVTTEEQVKVLGIMQGLILQSWHKIHLCSCCDNLFVTAQTEPTYCDVCLGELVHPLAGPIPAPKGVVA